MITKTLSLNAAEALTLSYLIFGGSNPYIPNRTLAQGEENKILCPGLLSEDLSIGMKLELRSFAKKLDVIISPVIDQVKDEIKTAGEDSDINAVALIDNYAAETEKKDITFTKFSPGAFDKVMSKYDYSAILESLCFE